MGQDIAYREALSWIHGIGRFGIKPGLERISALMERLGNPHHRLRFVHIAGSNGKGSTAVMLSRMLEAAGYRTGLFTSPYLVSFTNRIAVGGQDVAPAQLADLVARVRPLVEEIKKDPHLGQPTEFEVVTALAMAYFADRQPDLVVLEVGLGGRLDATNIVTPLLGIITNISLEHTNILGDTVEAIAAEKGGIIKPGVPLLTASTGAAFNVIEAICRDRGATVFRVVDPASVHFKAGSTAGCSILGVAPGGQYCRYYGLRGNILERLFIPLKGRYQLTNAAVALAAVELLSWHDGFQVDETAIRGGLKQAAWPGRLEMLSDSPRLILDGAHNPAAMEQLPAALKEYFQYRKLILVIGMLADKDIDSMLAAILPMADRVIVTSPEIDRALPAGALAGAVKARYAGPVREAVPVSRALQEAMAEAGEQDAVLITGSLYTVSEARAAWLKYANIETN